MNNFISFLFQRVFLIVFCCIPFVLMSCGGAGTSGSGLILSTSKVFNDGSGIATGSTSDGRKLIALAPSIVANINESNNSAFNLPEIDVNLYPIVGVSNGYNIRYIEEENAIIAEKIGSGIASIVYAEDITGDYMSTISYPVNSFPSGNFDYNGIFAQTSTSGKFEDEVGPVTLSANFENNTFSIIGQTDNSNLSGSGSINKSNGEILSENLSFEAPDGSNYSATTKGLFGKTNASEVSGIFYTNDQNTDYIGTFSANR